MKKPVSPLPLPGKNNIIIISSENFPFQPGTVLSEIDGVKVFNTESIEVICNFYTAGQFVTLTLINEDRIENRAVNFEKFYALPCVLLQIFSALMFVIIGNFVLPKGIDKKAAMLFYYTTTGTAAIPAMTRAGCKFSRLGRIY